VTVGSVTWSVDDRPARLWTRVYMAAMWAHRDKDAFAGAEHTLREAMRRQRAGDRAPTRWTRWRRHVTTSRREGMTVWSVRPRRVEPRVRILYLHGGGYVHPLTRDYWRLVRALTSAEAEVVVPAYPLAPRAHVDDTVPLLVELAGSLSDLPLVLMGDSAGGALSLVVGRRLTDDGRRPRGIVLLSPWLDAALGDDEVADLEAADPMLTESGLRAAGRWWAGARSVLDPAVSPVSMNLRGLPPILVHIGDRDILRPAVERLARAAEGTDGARLTVRERTAMFHVWVTRFIPEGRATRTQLVRHVHACRDQV
jgi:monoterpene epsilon-lactone hydrolase